MNELDRIVWDLSNDAVDGLTIRTRLGFLCLVCDSLTNGLLSQGIEIRSTNLLEVSPPRFFVEQDASTIFADDG